MCLSVGNESVPKIIIKDTTNLLFKTAVSILVILNHSGFRVLFDELASVYLYFSIENGQPSTVPIVSAHFRSLLVTSVSCSKTDEPFQNPFGMWTRAVQ